MQSSGMRQLAKAALKTKGHMPPPAKIAKDIDRGKASYKYDSHGERYLQYEKSGKTYHKDLHSKTPVRQVQLRQGATLGLTKKTATIVTQDKKFLGMKYGERTTVLISRETVGQKMAGADRDELRGRINSRETGAAGKLWAKAQDKVYKSLNAEGYRKATMQEAIRAKLSAAFAGAKLRHETKDRLQAKANAPERIQQQKTPQKSTSAPDKASIQEAIRAKLGAAFEGAKLREETREAKANAPEMKATPTPSTDKSASTGKGREMEM